MHYSVTVHICTSNTLFAEKLTLWYPGSPNGATFAYFLIQHKAELGYKTITKVTIIRPESDDDNDFVDASLVFHVEDAPEPPPYEGGTKKKDEKQPKYVVEVVEEDDDEMLRVHEFSI